MVEAGGAVRPEVHLRAVEDDDIEVFFANHLDPEGLAMAAVPRRERDQFMANWARIRADDTKLHRTVVADGVVAGNVVSWEEDGVWLVGYWLGREHWGRGVATRALELFVAEVPTRPLMAHVALHNVGSMRVLEKCGFRRHPELEATAPPPPDGIREAIFVLSA